MRLINSQTIKGSPEEIADLAQRMGLTMGTGVPLQAAQPMPAALLGQQQHPAITAGGGPATDDASRYDTYRCDYQPCGELYERPDEAKHTMAQPLPCPRCHVGAVQFLWHGVWESEQGPRPQITRLG